GDEKEKGPDCSGPYFCPAKAGHYVSRGDACVAPTSLEIDREVQTHEPRSVEAGRGAPAASSRRVVRAVDIRLIPLRRGIGVEHIEDVQADVRARSAEAHDLRDSH